MTSGKSGETCTYCGQKLWSDGRYCSACGRPPDPRFATAQTEVRQYRGNAQSIQLAFQADLARMQAQGYEPISQSTIPGHRGGCMGCLGVATLGLMFLFVRPQDTLIVTYRRTASPASGTSPAGR